MQTVDLLVCAATLPELRCFRSDGDSWHLAEGDIAVEDGVSYLVTGAGVPATLGRLLPALVRLQPRRVLDIGIAGAYPGSGLAIGDIVMGESETYGDIGFELPEKPGFRSVGETPWGRDFYGEAYPLSLDSEFRCTAAAYRFHTGGGCTVNTCTGTERTGRLRERLFSAAFESMEGAAVAQAGAQAGIPVCEVRAISNVASHRDMRPENIARALANLTHYLESCRKRNP